MKQFFSIICFICIFCGLLTAASSDYLQIVPVASYQGMGESRIAVPQNASGFIYNPAALSRAKGVEIWLSHMEYIADFHYEYLLYAQELGFGYWGISASYFFVTPFADIDLYGNNNGQLKDSNLMLAPGYAYQWRLSQFDIAVGVGIKYINSVLHTYKANSIAFDTGCLIKASLLRFFTDVPEQNFSFGLSVQNIGGELAYAEEKVPLPLLMKTGIGYYAFGLQKHKLLLASAFHYNDTESSDISVGAEYSYSDLLFLRVGYVFTEAVNSYSFGLGGSYPLKTVELFFDFAFIPYGVLENVYMGTMGIRF